jgi:hypothetical protein
MPSLDDIPTLPTATLSADDQFAVIDGADRRSPRQATLAALKTFTLSGDLGGIAATSLGVTGAASVGDLSFSSLQFSGSPPTVDPAIEGRIWVDPDDGYTLKFSLGS